LVTEVELEEALKQGACHCWNSTQLLPKNIVKKKPKDRQSFELQEA
jgi:hypothetical protein